MLTIEPEVFWRRGGPPKRPNVPVPGSKWTPWAGTIIYQGAPPKGCRWQFH